MSIDFSGTTNPTESVNQPAAAPAADDTSVLLEYNGRTFTKQDLIKKLESADTFIETLKAERQQDRQLLEQAASKLQETLSAAELLNQVKAANQPTGEAAAPAINQEEIVARVREQLTQEKVVEKQEQNWNDVTAKLAEVYKDKVNEKVAAIAKDNDLTLDEAASLARTKPALFLKLFPELAANKAKPSALHSSTSKSSFVATETAQPAAKTGFSAAKNTKDSVSIYLQRLNELSR